MKRGHAKVQEFALYGEKDAPGLAPHLHIEHIQHRARRYAWEIAPHRHAHLCQVLFVAAGPASIHVDETSEQAEAPAMAIVPPGTVHAFQFTERTQGFVLTLSAAAIVRAGQAAAAEHDAHELLEAVFARSFVGALYDHAALAARLTALLERLHAEFHEPDAAEAPIAGWLANSILWILARHVAGLRARTAQAPVRQRAWLKFRALAEAHYHEQWKVTRYARQLGMTAGRLNRLCREQCGLSAARVLQQRLALEARRRLIYVDIPIARLAGELGFHDAAYFCRFFKRHAGASPRDYRRQALAQRMGLSSAPE
jgi:AraC family transcriptional regulator, transcriptional activator of pobA